jgi:hypothetical protein
VAADQLGLTGGTKFFPNPRKTSIQLLLLFNYSMTIHVKNNIIDFILKKDYTAILI